MTIEYILPISVILPRKTKPDKKFMLNLNVYRNTHHQTLTAAKKAFQPISGKSFTANKIRISYVVEKTTKRRFDTNNIVSIVDKFFCDWLVNNGCIVDDNCDIVSYGYIEGLSTCEQSRVIAKIEILA